VQYDSSQAVPGDRIKVYIDGVLLSADVGATYPAQNSKAYNDDVTSIYKFLGVGSWFQGSYPVSFMGVLKDTYFIDGATVSASDIFTNGYSGLIGAGGFHLEYNDEEDIGKDTSGNSNGFLDGFYLEPPNKYGSYYYIPVVQVTESPSRISGTTFTFHTIVNVTGAGNWDTILSIGKYLYSGWGPFVTVARNDDMANINFYMADYTYTYIWDYYTEESIPYGQDVAITVCVDTTQINEINRIKVYIDGVLCTGTSGSTYPPQNYDFFYKEYTDYAPIYVSIGSDTITGYGYPYTGKLANTIYVDGLSIDGSSFGPNYTGPYGDNGWHLKYTNVNNLGEDSNPNG
jgi:hypothetical protein